MFHTMTPSADSRRFFWRGAFRIIFKVAVGIAVVGALVMLLWNWLMPALFSGAQPIGYWQALGILLLSKILFGGFHGDFRSRMLERRERMERWERMTPEERDVLKERVHSRWSHWCGPSRRDRDNPDEAPRTGS
jgi:hypothetical protein